MKKSTFSLIFNDVDESHLGKDVFLVPYYWCKINQSVGSIIYPEKDGFSKLQEYHRGIQLISLKKYLKRSKKSYWISALIYLLRNARTIDTLMQFHFSDNTLYIGNFYKLLNPKGFLYIKCDGEYWLDTVLTNVETQRGFAGKIKRHMFNRLLRKVDLITIETERGYEKLQSRNYCSVNLKDKAHLLENGFDEDLMKDQSIRETPFMEKENLIITVGRLGTWDKNTELILEAAKDISFNQWKIVLIGPIEPLFQRKIDKFFFDHPHLKERIVFTGSISNKKELWEWYNRAKVYLLTSRNESFALVLMEAYRFNNYIVSTDVGWAQTAINKSFGEIIPQEDAVILRNTLQHIIENDIDIIKKQSLKINVSYEKSIRRIL